MFEVCIFEGGHILISQEHGIDAGALPINYVFIKLPL